MLNASEATLEGEHLLRESPQPPRRGTVIRVGAHTSLETRDLAAPVGTVDLVGPGVRPRRRGEVTPLTLCAREMSMTPGPRGGLGPVIEERLPCLGETEEAWLFAGEGVVQHLALLKADLPARVRRVRVRIEVEFED